MEVWKQASVDLVVPGFIEFELEDDHVLGQFQFATVTGGLDCRIRSVDGASHVEWSCEGRSARSSPSPSRGGAGKGWCSRHRAS